jgi:hypothetical protein
MPKTSKPSNRRPPRPRIGWRERVDLPEWGVRGISAKVDTGARTSAIHVQDVVRLRGDQVLFHLITRRRPLRHVAVRALLVRTARVRSSSGHTQERFVVRTVARIGPVKKLIELSLVGRDQMLCRMLLGRSALTDFLIDVNLKYSCSTADARPRRARP